MIPAHKKGNELEKLPSNIFASCCWKMFERILYNSIYEFFTENNLISPNQSGFKPGDSCTNQLTSKKYIFIESTNLLTMVFKKQRVVFNGQYSSWASIETGVLQGSILGPLLFFIYVNDLSDDLATNVKLFADDTSLFSVVQNMNTSTTNLNNDLNKIRNWAIQWKMNFNPDPNKQAQEVVFSRKLQQKNHNPVYSNHNPVQQVLSQKHLRIYLDTKLNFQEHLNHVLSKVNKTIGLLRKFEAFLTRQPLVTLYKAIIRPNLN